MQSGDLPLKCWRKEEQAEQSKAIWCIEAQYKNAFFMWFLPHFYCFFMAFLSHLCYIYS